MKRPIGIFDSGIGGLTVFKEIRKQFPSEDIIYFGDTARVPYGPKSSKTVIEYSIQNTRFLIQQNVKLIVIACNTSSSVAIPILTEMFDIPIIGVIIPGAQSAIEVTKNNKIGVIGTYGTIKSKSYINAIKEINPQTSIFSKACPLFVAIAEEGWEDHFATEVIAEEYLKNMREKNID
ncbi:MAG: glutamate racemase, partial [Candidatus Cloacimonadota bacterium]|nr:glutamate racemase [Candidatus Cloacimonadota bacterium]